VPKIWQRLLKERGHVRVSDVLVTEFDRTKDAVPGMYVSLLYVTFIASTCQFGTGQSALLLVPTCSVEEGMARTSNTVDRSVSSDDLSVLPAMSLTRNDGYSLVRLRR